MKVSYVKNDNCYHVLRIISPLAIKSLCHCVIKPLIDVPKKSVIIVLRSVIYYQLSLKRP